MRRGDVYERVDAPIEQFYFIEHGMISLVKVMRDGRTIER